MSLTPEKEPNSMFDTLLELPLFKGVSREKITEIVEKAKFHFLKYLPGGEVIRPGEPCSHLKFVLSGNIRLTIANEDSRFSVGQTLSGPDVILPDFLFGRATSYPCRGEALTPLSILQIEKSDYLKILTMDRVFLLNYLNFLSMNAQKAVDGVLALSMGSIETRIAFWIISLTQPTGIDIKLQCKQRALSSVFGVQRSSLISALDNMKNAGLIDYRPGEVEILSRRGLLSLLLENRE